MLSYVHIRHIYRKKYKNVLDPIKCMHILAALILVHTLFLKLNKTQL